MTHTAKKAWKPTINIAQLIHIFYQIQNLTTHSVDELLDMLFSGNFSADVKQLILDTFNHIKDDPIDVGANAFIYLAIFKIAKKAARGTGLGGKVDFGFFYLQPI